MPNTPNVAVPDKHFFAKGGSAQTASQDFFDNIGLGSMVSMANIPQTLQSFTTAGMLFDYENILNFMRLVFIDPEVTEEISVSYEEIKTLGRTIPQFGYINTSGRKIDLDIHFIADVCPVVQVDHKIKWLKTFLYPRDSGTSVRPPKKIVLCLGLYLWMKGVVTSLSVTYKKPFGGLATSAGFLPMLPQYATVRLSIAETEEFWSGGQMTYERALLDEGFGLIGAGLPSYVSSALNIM